jgi:hypothetical protein
LTGLENGLDPRYLAGNIVARDPHLAGVEDPIASLSDVDEGRLHAGQDVLDPAEIDIPPG